MDSAADLQQIDARVGFSHESTGARRELLDLAAVIGGLTASRAQEFNKVSGVTDATAARRGQNVKIPPLNIGLFVRAPFQNRALLRDQHHVAQARKDLIDVQLALCLCQVDAIRRQRDDAAGGPVRGVDFDEVARRSDSAIA